MNIDWREVFGTFISIILYLVICLILIFLMVSCLQETNGEAIATYICGMEGYISHEIIDKGKFWDDYDNLITCYRPKEGVHPEAIMVMITEDGHEIVK
jgi:hypothetical protein